jgi:hypothetical protein
VRDRLSVAAEGLFIASAALHEHADQLVPAHGAVPVGAKASSEGATSVHAAIAAFNMAYGARLADRGQAAARAGKKYTTVDHAAADDIGDVSV